VKVGDLVRLGNEMGIVVGIESRNSYGDAHAVRVWWGRTKFLGSAFAYALEFLCEA
tara:strand:+ start:496 stop:663 length:168 start_codon:yes stop_codon:yes gene_type:complete